MLDLPVNGCVNPAPRIPPRVQIHTPPNHPWASSRPRVTFITVRLFISATSSKASFSLWCIPRDRTMVFVYHAPCIYLIMFANFKFRRVHY